MDASTPTGEQDGVATATLAAGELEATFATGAGMVCCSLRHRGAELLGQRRGLATYAATGSTMGIPFLHPWATRLAGPRYEQGGRTVALRDGAPGVRLEEHGLPMHGLLGGSRDRRVAMLEAGDDEARLVAELSFERPELSSPSRIASASPPRCGQARCASRSPCARPATPPCPCPSAFTPTCSSAASAPRSS
jgi:galactose mutarotase-like enzyme